MTKSHRSTALASPSRHLFKLGACALSLAPMLAFGATYNVADSASLRTRLANAATGDVIVLAAGKTFTMSSAVSGIKTLDGVTTTAPIFALKSKTNITVKGASATNKPIIKGNGTGNGEYAFYAQKADGFKLLDVKIENSEKGLIVDRSNNVTIQGVEFKEIGWEALHIRDGSKNAVIKSNKFSLIGVDRNDRGEAVYIGSDNKKWPTNPELRSGDSIYQPACDNALVESNTFGPNIGGEAVDVKEGVTGTIIRNNSFNMGLTDTRLKNSSDEKADSAIDVKGYKTVVMNNSFNASGNANIATAIDVYALIKQTDADNTGWNKWGYNNFITKNSASGLSSAAYVVRVPSVGGGKIGCNTPADKNVLINSTKKASVTIITGSACNTPSY